MITEDELVRFLTGKVYAPSAEAETRGLAKKIMDLIIRTGNIPPASEILRTMAELHCHGLCDRPTYCQSQGHCTRRLI